MTSPLWQLVLDKLFAVPVKRASSVYKV